MTPATPPYDSTLDTLRHSRRVDELLLEVLRALTLRVTHHDASKMEEPEKPVFDRVTQRLRASTYGSDEYQGFLADMGEGLAHHYAHNRHHPEFFPDGVAGMNLVDLVEMLADWRAAGERHHDGSMTRSLELGIKRFGIEPQLAAVLANTARGFGWDLG